MRATKILLFLTMVFVPIACTTIREVPVETVREVEKTVERRDSIYVRDSVFIDRWRTGDTVYITENTFRYVYRDVLVHDSICIVDTITQVIEVQATEKWYDKVATGAKYFIWILVLLIVLLFCWKFLK